MILYKNTLSTFPFPFFSSFFLLTLMFSVLDLVNLTFNRKRIIAITAPEMTYSLRICVTFLWVFFKRTSVTTLDSTGGIILLLKINLINGINHLNSYKWGFERSHSSFAKWNLILQQRYLSFILLFYPIFLALIPTIILIHLTISLHLLYKPISSLELIQFQN